MARIRSITGWHARREGVQTGASILLYHGVVERISHPHLQEYCIDRKNLKEHIHFVKSKLCPVSMADLIDAVKNNEVDRRFVVLSFDDALENQFILGADLLGAAGIPWTVAVPVGLVSSDRTIWTNEVSLLILLGNIKRIPNPTTSDGFLPTETEAERRLSAGIVKNFLANRADGIVRERYIQGLMDACGQGWLTEKIKALGFRMATWNQIKSVERNVEFISHGMYHASQNAFLSESEMETEYVGSRKLMEARIGTAPKGFALPNGIHTDRSVHWLQEGGYMFCLTSAAGRVGGSTSLFSLPRFSAEVNLPILRNLMAIHHSESAPTASRP